MAFSATADTVSDIFTKVSDKLGELTADTTSARQRSLKDVLADIYNRRRWKWAIKDGTNITLVSGTDNYTLDSDFTENSMYQVWYEDSAGNKTYLFPINEYDAPSYANGSGTQQVYFIRGNRADGYKIYLVPTPTSSINGFTLKHKYYRNISNFAAALTDIIPLPTSEPLVLGVLKEVYRSQQRLNEYQIARQEYEIAIGELEKTDSENERSLMNSMVDFRTARGLSSDVESAYAE